MSFWNSNVAIPASRAFGTGQTRGSRPFNPLKGSFDDAFGKAVKITERRLLKTCPVAFRGNGPRAGLR